MNFRNPSAKALWAKIQKDSHIDQSGIDKSGMVYVSWLNGVTKRYTQAEFIKMAKKGFYPSYTY